MKVHFKEEYSKFSYEFIEDGNFPERELVTCVFAMLHKEWKIYLTKNYRGWELPWGHIEKWENFDEALDREMAEEVWTGVKNKRLFWYKKYSNSEKSKNRDWGFYPFPNSYLIFYIWEATWENCKIDCPDTLDYGLFTFEEALEKVESKWTRKIIEIMNKEMQNKKYSLALWGWAARWLAHIWVLKYLEEKNIEIEEISWTSMGAIIASLIAIWKNSDEIKEFAKSINYLKMADFDFKTGLLKWEKIKKKMEELFWDKKIEDCKIPLKIIATNLEKAESRIFTKWKIVDILRATFSLPWIFTPQNIDWEDYIDWGIMMNLPIEALDWKNIIAVSALKINTWKIVEEKKFLWINIKTGFWKNNFEIIKRSVILMMKVNEDNSLKTPNKNIKFIRPNFWKLDIMHFNKIDEFIKIGYRDAKKLEI